MLTANATLAIFVMLGLSSFAVFWAKQVRLPHTVFLVVVGVFLGILAQFDAFHFFAEFKLTPELLFYLLLPTLIFESAYNINVRRMVEETVPVLLLAIISLVISTLVIAGILFVAFEMIGFAVPFIVLLLFGALISATDPVAVLALFKEYGAPRRLSLIFEGESLFNDATAVALFLVLLEIVIRGYEGFHSVLDGLVTFSSMLIGGTLFGLLIGAIFVMFINFTKKSETATITLTIVLAHVTFILTEIVSHHMHFGEYHLALSPIISTTVSALLMGNYGRTKIHPSADEFVEKLWGQLAFMCNSLIFILIGILFVDVPLIDKTMLMMVGITILTVAFARALSIYPVVSGFNLFASTERKISSAWQHLLSWGSLRGALAVTMVLLIPPELTFGVENPISIRDLLLTLTVGCIFATLFIKATTIQTFMKRLKLDVLTPLETIEYHEAKALLSHEITEGLDRYVERGYIDGAVATKLKDEHAAAYQAACKRVNEISQETRHELSHTVLRLYAIGIERRHLKELYHHSEVSENVYRKLMGKLQLQFEAIESGNLKPDMSIHTDSKDVFEVMAAMIRKFVHTPTEAEKVSDLYMYYRAQSIISRKVVKELTAISTENAENIFTPAALEATITVYSTFRDQSAIKMDELAHKHPEITQKLAAELAACSIDKIAENVLHSIQSRELITPKLYITLRDEVAKTADHQA